VFIKTSDQSHATDLLTSSALHTMLYGGSRSGKTFLLVYAIFLRALKEKNSRHIILRFRFAHAKASLIYGTIPDVFRLCFAAMGETDNYLNKQDWCYRLPNGSEVWVGGLDDKERTEKILGNEYSTIYFNECSQIPYSSVLKARTRLAQKNGLSKKFYYDENPPSRGHWTFKEFIEHLDPVAVKPLPADDYVSMLMNPAGNRQNLDPIYIKILENLPEAERNRFLLGLFGDAVSGVVFGAQLNAAYKGGRVRNIPYDPSKEVQTWWDIGRSDYTAIWFLQDFGTEVRYIDFLQDNFKELDFYAKELKAKIYNFGSHNLPHDAAHKRLGMGGKSIGEQLEGMGIKNTVHPVMSSKKASIDQTRVHMSKCYFDHENCREGLEALEAYHYEYDEKHGMYKDAPEHDWSSHGAEAFIYSAIGKAISAKGAFNYDIYNRS
jgi:hypothetical protein